MERKPDTVHGYARGHLDLVRSTCLYVATKLGDLLDDIVVVGGLVPSLIIDQASLKEDNQHVGTRDLDLGLQLSLLNEERYRAVSQRLRDAGFSPDETAEGRLIRQRWQITPSKDLKVTVDFLISPSSDRDKGGTLRNLESDFAAFIIAGLRLAFQDRLLVRISGRTIFGERATREVPVCGPGAFVVLKGLAFNDRGENKDAYDLYYLLRNFGSGVEDVASRLRLLRGEAEVEKAIEILRRDFNQHDDVGPLRVAHFLHGRADDEVQADVVGFVSALLGRC